MSLDYQSIIAVFAAIAKFFWWLGDVFLKAISAVADSGYLEAIIVFLVMAIIVLFCKVGKNNFAGIAAKKKKLGIIGIGILGNSIMVYGFNWVLYPFVIRTLGLINGFFLMTFLSFVICYATILFYNWSKKDWLGIETLKELKEYDGSSKISRMVSWIMRRGDFAILVFLSVKYDPFITTVYMRHGANEFNSMTRRDWCIFMASLIIGDVWWAIAVFSGISGIEHVIGLFK